MFSKIISLFRPDPQKRFNKMKSDYKLFVEGVQTATQTILYEGLPHQDFEEDSLWSELVTKAVIHRCKYPFYTEALALDDGDAQQLKTLVCEGELFIIPPTRLAKYCGGFHPDYCMEWQNGDDTYDALLCF